MDFRKVTPDSINYLRAASIAEQAKLYIKLTKLHRLAAQNVWFNQQCKRLKVIPNYISIRTNGRSHAGAVAVAKAKMVWLGEECRYWFSVRDNLKLHLRILHTELCNRLHNVEFDILDGKARELAAKVANQKYRIQARKLQQLTHSQHGDNGIQSTQRESAHSFYPRVKNLTDVPFPPSEVALMEKGLKYNLSPKVSQRSLEELAVDTEIACIRGKQDIGVKHQAASCITRALRSSNPLGAEQDTYLSLQRRLQQNDLILSKADKGNSIVILKKQEYSQKVQDIIQGEDFQPINSDPTTIFIRELKQVINNVQYLPPNDLRNIIPMNPRPPLLYGLPKLHKENIPMRPVVSYIEAPAYKLAQYLNTTLKSKMLFKPNNSLRNTIDLVSKIKDIHIPRNAKLLSLDVESLFTNVPCEQVIKIITDKLQRRRLHPGEIEDLMSLTSICMKQNYFQFNNQFYKQKEGLAMGSPLSPLMADVFMDDFESKHMVGEPNIMFYYRYVDDIIICWTGTQRQLTIYLNRINAIHRKIKFKLEEEENNSLNFLDVTITRTHNKLEFQVYRKPTHTDIVIPNTSNHPVQHKLAAFRSYVHRLMTIPLTAENYAKELNVIYQIAMANGYTEKMVDSLIRAKQQSQVRLLLYPHSPERINQFRGSLTYLGPTTERVAKLLRRNDVHVAFRTSYNMRRLCNGKDRIQSGKKSGVYKLTCDECSGVYIGQTGRNFATRYKEHIAAHRNGNPEQSNFAKHLLDSGHTLNTGNTFEILHICPKGFRMSVMEKLEIYKHQNSHNALLNDQTGVTSPLLRCCVIQPTRDA